MKILRIAVILLCLVCVVEAFFLFNQSRQINRMHAQVVDLQVAVITLQQVELRRRGLVPRNQWQLPSADTDETALIDWRKIVSAGVSK